MASIRTTLVLGTVIATLAIVALAGGAVYQGERSALVRQIDKSLESEARLLGSAVKNSSEGIDLEFSELDMRDFGGDAAQAYLQLWADDGTVVYSSPGLGRRNLPAIPDASNQPAFRWSNIGEASHVRVVTMAFRSTAEDEEDSGPDATTVESIGGYIVLGRDASEVARVLARLRLLLASVGITSGLLAAVSLSIVIGRGLRPLDDLAGRISALRDRDLSRRVVLSATPREIAPVVDELNELLERLETAFERERTFSADIAHELRTPLAGLLSTAEVTLSRPRDADDYVQAMQESLEMISRLQEMVETILYLGSLDAGRVEAEPHSVDLNELVESSLRPMLGQARDRNVSVQWKLDSMVRVSTDPLLLGMVIRNLLDNAVSYVDDNGRIGVEVNRKEERGVFRVVNSGSVVAQEQVATLLGRFTRIDSARSGTGTHFGLGLALVGRIAAVLGCEIDIQARVGGDFEVVLSMPGENLEEGC